MKLYFITAVAIGLIVGPSQIEARGFMMCYQCDSNYEPGCAAPFDNRTFPLYSCPQGHDKCSITVENNGDDRHFTRACASEGHVLSHTGCLMAQTGNKRECFCDTRGCNQDTEFYLE